MICPICERESNVVCTCGFCKGCISQYGHDKCIKIEKEMREDEKNDSDNSID